MKWMYISLVAAFCAAGCQNAEPVVSQVSPSDPQVADKPRPSIYGDLNATVSQENGKSKVTFTPPSDSKTNPPDTTKGMPRIITMPTAPPPQPKYDNPAVGKPRPGEVVAKNFSFDVGQRHVEVEGVCKFDDTSATCWLPDGTPSPKLSEEMTKAIEASNASYSPSVDEKLKTRVVILKERIANPQADKGQVTVYDMHGPGADKEGWSRDNARINLYMSRQSTPGIRRSVLTGKFIGGNENYPIRYLVMNHGATGKPEVIPAKVGKYSAFGNEIEIVSISFKPSKELAKIKFQAEQTRKTAYVTAKVNSVADRHSAITLVPADEKGETYAWFDEKGNRVSKEQAAKMMEEAKKKPYHKNPKARSYVIPEIRGYSPGGIHFDFSRMGTSPFPMTMPLFVSKDLLKNFAVFRENRTVYVFDGIQLDPK